MLSKPAFPLTGAFLFPGGALWNPAALSPLHWLDAADAATLSLSGSAVTAWADKGSAGGSWTQSTPANRPTYSASDMGYAGVRFNAASVQELTRALSSTPSEIEIVMVFRLDADPPSSAGNCGIWKLGSTGTSTPVVPFVDGSNYDNAGSTSRHDGTYHGTNFASANAVYSVISTASEWTNFEQWTQRYTTGTNTVHLPATLGIGASSGAFAMMGVVREVIIFPAKLSTPDRTSLRSYLTSKWGTP